MLTRPFTRLVVAFGVRKITQRRLVEEFVTGTLILIPFGVLVGLITSRICTKIRFQQIRSDVWTTLVVFLIGDILMEWLLPSLGCLPVPHNTHMEGASGAGAGAGVGAAISAISNAMNLMNMNMNAINNNNINIDDDDYVSTIFNGDPKTDLSSSSSSSSFREDEYHYTITWLLQSYGLYCPADFANSDSLLTPDATAILFSIRLIFLCIGVHIGESIGCFVALTGGIATGKSTAAKMFVDCNYTNNNSNSNSNSNNSSTMISDNNDDNDNNKDKDKNNDNNKNNNNGGESNNNNSSIRNRRNSKKSSHQKKSGGGGGGSNNNSDSNSNNNNNKDDDDDEIMEEIANSGPLGLISAILTAWGRTAFSGTLFMDDGGGGGYNEGTVQLICADSIAHNILLPPEVLSGLAAAQRRNNSSSSSSSSSISMSISSSMSSSAAAAMNMMTGNNNNNNNNNNSNSNNNSEGEDDEDNDDDDQQQRDNDDDNDENDSGEEGDGDNRKNDDDDGDDGENDDQTRIIRIVSPSDSVYHQIIRAFEGKDILEPSTGHIDRLKLGAIIFNDREERKKLNRITHPKILSVLLKKLLRSVFFGYADITMGDLPLLFESGKLSWLFGVTICVTTSEKVQLRRLIQRNPELPEEECQARIDSQMALAEKEEKADIVIDNDGDLEQLREQVEDARRDIMGRLYGIGMSLLQMLLLIGGSTSIAVSSKFYTHWQQ